MTPQNPGKTERECPVAFHEGHESAGRFVVLDICIGEFHWLRKSGMSRVLTIEDDETTANDIAVGLRKRGFSVDWVDNAEHWARRDLCGCVLRNTPVLNPFRDRLLEVLTGSGGVAA